jgi:hypothetical protein
MKVSPEPVFPPSTASAVDRAQVRSPENLPIPFPGKHSTTGNDAALKAASTAARTQDEVKLQWDSQDQIAIYQFIDPQGKLVVQVPSEQMVNLAREISRQLIQEAAPHPATANRGGKPNGH